MVVSMTRELFSLFVLCFHERILEKVESRVDPFFFLYFSWKHFSPQWLWYILYQVYLVQIYADIWLDLFYSILSLNREFASCIQILHERLKNYFDALVFKSLYICKSSRFLSWEMKWISREINGINSSVLDREQTRASRN